MNAAPFRLVTATKVSLLNFLVRLVNLPIDFCSGDPAQVVGQGG